MEFLQAARELRQAVGLPATKTASLTRMSTRSAGLSSTTARSVRMTGIRVAQASRLCTLCIVLSGPVAAEPLTTASGSLPAAITVTEPEPPAPSAGVIEPPKVGAPGIIDRALVGNESPNSSKTVELLLEMQGKNPGLAAGERPKAEMPSSRPATAASSAKPAFGGDPASPFGGPDALRAKPTAGDPEAVDWSGTAGAGLGAGLSGGGSLSAAGGPREPYRPDSRSARPSVEEDSIWLLPRKLIRFVRENRDMVVLGSIGLLLLLWAVSSFTAGRRK